MIERLYVNNFRCLESFSIDFVDRPSALVIGKNGSGKSTLRQAFEVLQKVCRGSNRTKQLIVETDFAQQRKHIPIRFEVDLRLTNKRFKYIIAFEFPENFHEARVAEESLNVDGNIIFSRKQGEVNQPGGSTFGVDWHLAALPAIYLVDRVGDSLKEQIRSYFASMILIAPIPANMEGFSEEESVELRRDAGNFSAWLNALLLRYPAAYNVIYSYLQPVIPDLLSFENVPRGEKGKQLLVRFAHGGVNGDLSIDFKHLSDGEKCFFLSALIVASNKVARPVFCFWDEPDNHLSLPEIGHFITQLRKLSNEKGQFIATSHHPETIRKFSDENTLVFTRRSHLEPTIVRPLADFPYSGDLIEALVRDEVIG
jgi:predicted ATPase